MRKRKNGTVYWTDRISIILVALGLMLVATICAGAILQWALEESTQIWAVPTSIWPRPTLPQIVKAPTEAASTLPEGVQILLSKADGSVVSNDSASAIFQPIGIWGTSAVESPDKTTFAHISGEKLYVYRNGHEQLIATDKGAKFPVWSVDGNWLAFAVSGQDADTVYRVRIADALVAVMVIRVPNVAALQFSPYDNRLLIAQVDWATSKTTLFTIDPDCDSEQNCADTRRPTAVIPRRINGLSYHPNGSALAFSDADDGNIYMLRNDGSGTVTPLIRDANRKVAPAFSHSGDWLAYIDQTNGSRVILRRLSDLKEVPVGYQSVVSVTWIS